MASFLEPSGEDEQWMFFAAGVAVAMWEDEEKACKRRVTFRIWMSLKWSSLLRSAIFDVSI